MGKDISSSDVLQLGLDRQLTLSVRFVGAVSGQRGHTIPRADAKCTEMPTLDGMGIFVFIGGTVTPGQDKVIVFEDQISTISDIWDLPMIGGEELHVEQLYEISQLRIAPELFNLEGTFVTDFNQQYYYKLVERFTGEELGGKLKLKEPYRHPDNYFPSTQLPSDSVIVARTQVLRDFAQRLNKGPPAAVSKPLERRERTTLLTIIAALAQMAKIDVTKPSSAATAIESATARLGARVAARTIENHLKRIDEALESRGD